MNPATLAELTQQALVYKTERQASFANPPKDCQHTLVYLKEGDDMHCNSCDQFMYTDRGDYEYDD